MKIKNKKDLVRVGREASKNLAPRFRKDKKNTRHHILVCSGTGCHASKSRLVRERLEKEVKKLKLAEQVQVFKTGCFGFCKLGPIVMVHPEGTFYCHVEPDDIDEILEQHILKGQVAEKLLYRSMITHEIQQTIGEIDFFNHQMRVALRNCGEINPEDIKEYIAMDGYMALADILTQKTPPKDIIEELKRSGLRGRGGGGFLTGQKWEYAARYSGDEKYVLCNADEGDPGAFMDRSILEGDPHSIIEALIIAGYCIGASKGFIYVRAEYPIAVERLEIAIKQAKSAGLLGKNILGSSFSFNLEIRLGAGAFVCGEETALIQSVMGFRGEPRPRPPFPAEVGLWEMPTLNNNVETYANIPIILQKGADWYAGIGTEDSKGTKVFALAGQIKNTGLIEVPMGTTLSTIIYEIGGGFMMTRPLKEFKPAGLPGAAFPLPCWIQKSTSNP
jgi:NADP-reducing hydrogenase subunit HndC